MLDQRDYIQSIPPLNSSFSTLLAHPNVQDGLRTGIQAFQEGLMQCQSKHASYAVHLDGSEVYHFMRCLQDLYKPIEM